MQQSILQKLGPNFPTPFIGITLYIIAFLCLIALFMQKKSNLTVTMLLSFAIMAALIDKVDAWRNIPGANTQFVALVLRIAVFVMPIVAAGMVRAPSEKSRGPAILAGIIGVIYMLARWYLEQRPA